MEPKDRDEHLSKEYLRLQQVIEDFDSKALTIKAWSVTLSAAGIVTAYSQGKATILIVSAASALIFWLVEAMWKSMQQAHYPRVEDIERHFRECGDIPPYQINAFWTRSWDDRRRTWIALKILTWPHVFLPHIVVAIAATVLFLAIPPVPGG
jgi:hypothetical protein